MKNHVKNIFCSLAMPAIFTIWQLALAFAVIFGLAILGINNLFLGNNIYTMTLCITSCLYLNYYFKKHKIELFTRVDTRLALLHFFEGMSINVFFVLVLSLIEKLTKLNLTEQFSDHNLAPIVLCITYGVLQPMIEEIIFRYFTFKHLKPINSKLAIIVSALLFGILHLELIQAIYTFFLGLILGYVYDEYDNIKYPMFLHIGFNGMAVLMSIM